MLVVFTGPVRSGKSSAGLRLALASGKHVVIAVGAKADDEEMERRIARHRSERPDEIAVIDATRDGWLAEVPADACLLVDCLGSVLGSHLWDVVPPDAELLPAEAEEAAERQADTLMDALLARTSETVVVTNEVGWGVVPASASGRLFRDVLGRANRRLVACADDAWLVIAGRCLRLRDLPEEVSWPKR